jgi:hypothetical protein
VVVRRPTSVLAALLAGALAVSGACSGDDHRSTPDLSSTTSTELPSRNDPALQPYLLGAGDLPAGFAASTATDNTVTTFCAGQDAVAGLRATARAFAAFSRTPAGAAVVHLIFRFRAGEATTFVDQSMAILDTCSNVPDIRGLAFAYDPSTPAVDAALAGTDGHVSRHGTSVGKGNLSEDVAMFRQGDVGELVAVLTDGQARDQTDALALAAFTAAVKKAPAG